MDVKDIPRVIKEAFYLARTGRPGELAMLMLHQDVFSAAHIIKHWTAHHHSLCKLHAGWTSRTYATHGPSLVHIISDIEHESPLPGAGPVLVDIPKDVQQTLDVPDW